MKPIPCPRLELRWTQINEQEGGWHYGWLCTYSLVIPLDRLDKRSTDADGSPREKSLEIGTTKVVRMSPVDGGWRPVSEDGIVDTPFRDGAHARLDCDALGGHLPIIAICGEDLTVVAKQPRRSSSNTFSEAAQ